MEEYYKLGIKELAVEDRPREKMLHKGISALSDADLVAILIGSGSAKESAVELARKIMAGYKNNLNELAKATIEELKSGYHGVGEAKAISIVAAMELGRRRLLHQSLEMPSIKSSSDIYNLFRPVIAHLPHEEFWITLLNRANKVRHRFNISKGGLTGTVIDVRLILKKGLENNASSMILCHNHPSGNIQPSEADIHITSKLKDAGKIMEIPVLDHLIVTENGYFSFADEGMI
jgi:DNA repair protein RadC